MVTKAAPGPRLASPVADWLEHELRTLPTTRQMLADADAGRLGRSGQTHWAELSRILRMRELVQAVDAIRAGLPPEPATVYETLYSEHGRIDDAAAAAGISPRTAARIRQGIVTAIAIRLGMVSG
jgi:hypothetical protein